MKGVGGEAIGAETYLYVISCTLNRVKIGVAGDAEKRLRELQVGSPVELKLTLIRPYAERRDADAVAEELYRFFAGRRVRGSWYRLTVAEVRERLGQRATLEAPARARAAAEAAARERRVAAGRGGEQVAARTEKQLAYERRRRQERTRKQKRAARLLAQGMTQQAVAAELDVTTRTLRNWKAAPAFQRERERQHKHTTRQRAAPPHSKPKPRGRRDAEDARGDRPRRSRPAAKQTHPIDVEQAAERERLSLAAEEQANAADPPRSPAPSQHQGVPIFPDTPDGRAARLAYYEARKLNNPPTSLLDYHDAKRGLEPPAERHAREQRENAPPR
jgi:Homeodomain-like domain/Meiotically up-regulated gene 113